MTQALEPYLWYALQTHVRTHRTPPPLPFLLHGSIRAHLYASPARIGYRQRWAGPPRRRPSSSPRRSAESHLQAVPREKMGLGSRKTRGALQIRPLKQTHSPHPLHYSSGSYSDSSYLYSYLCGGVDRQQELPQMAGDGWAPAQSRDGRHAQAILREDYEFLHYTITLYTDPWKRLYPHLSRQVDKWP
ncbi:hypothetical protein FA10DRAFT_269220 [Acaromyces ingoldii]|uniref:Uncharacterized protein n=1 Tax=Acaromyces ingoldii TaxID=215250 RepID=A0A316YFH4_9BASI|nr:hypothetical protein FA10DRAFT_269220 [Acaromyces ingoldii]PWN87959.1 hypothetical protein FA10DRAFT_269220 [Acaromyces ingoldii]